MIESSTILQCPKCAAVVVFSNALSNIKECTCGSVLLKKDGSLSVASALNSATIKGYHIKTGTTGKFAQKSFNVLGKIGVWFEESFFSYWHIVFDDGQTAYLAEGYGLYSIMLPEKKNTAIKTTDLDVSKVGQVTNSKYQLQKKDSSYYWEVEGELSIENPNPYLEVYEYDDEPGKMIAIFDWSKDVIETFSKRAVLPEELQLQNTQEQNTLGIKLRCNDCSKEIKVQTYPLAQSCVCNNCGTFYAIEKMRLVKKGHSKNNQFTPLLPLGAKGVIKNISYQVIGYTRKQERNTFGAKWKEYVMFNPVYGFAFLSEFNGHWIYVKEKTETPVIIDESTRAFIFNNRTFEIFNSYNYDVIEASGEFPYNTFDNRDTQVKEYISPPQIWIREKNNKEGICWFHGENINGKDVKKAFVLSETMPYRTGVGAVQPTSNMGVEKLIVTCIAGILLLLGMHLLYLGTRQKRVITDSAFYFTDSSNKAKYVTDKFTLNDWRNIFSFKVSAPVSNSWFELNANLVNTETGKEYSVSQGVEYYYGYTGGENWTEGSTSETGYISSIPAGKYFLEIEGTKEAGSFNSINQFNLKVIANEDSFRNYWFAVLLFLIWPASNYLINKEKEKNRWRDSEYNNYTNY